MITRNAIQTPDGTILESTHVHDFKIYKDKLTGKEYGVDGGLEYCRYIGDIKDCKLLTNNYTIYSDSIEQEALDQFHKAMSIPCNVQGALMPDAHKGYTLPIGAVIKSYNKVFPSYVGYDIGCGVCAAKTDLHISQINLNELKNAIIRNIPLGTNRHKSPQTLPTFSEGTMFSKGLFNDITPYQIGTLGGGNHFIEVGASDDGFLQIIIHSGSRNFGKRVAEHYMKLALLESIDYSVYEAEFDKVNQHWQHRNPSKYVKAKKHFVDKRAKESISQDVEGHFGFDINSKSGKDYLSDMHLALEFALANRKAMIDSIMAAIRTLVPNKSINTIRFINRNHNHAEVKGNYVIHRKGATHAEFGMLGVIPGNMKDGSFIVEGKGNPEALNSSSHGAGRVLSRRKARDTLSYQDFSDSMSSIVSNHSESTIDEAPKAYKNIFEVMRLQSDLVQVIEHVRPLLNIKG